MVNGHGGCYRDDCPVGVSVWAEFVAHPHPVWLGQDLPKRCVIKQRDCDHFVPSIFLDLLADVTRRKVSVPPVDLMAQAAVNLLQSRRNPCRRIGRHHGVGARDRDTDSLAIPGPKSGPRHILNRVAPCCREVPLHKRHLEL